MHVSGNRECSLNVSRKASSLGLMSTFVLLLSLVGGCSVGGSSSTSSGSAEAATTSASTTASAATTTPATSSSTIETKTSTSTVASTSSKAASASSKASSTAAGASASGSASSKTASVASSSKTTTAATTAATTATSTASVSATTKTIDSYVSCTGTKDDSEGVMKAFADAANHAFELIVDCPVYIHSGLDIGHVIFIDNGTSVAMTGAGKFIVDNVMHPAFAIANSNNVYLNNWVVEYSGSLPVNPNVGGYYQNGVWTAIAGSNQPQVWNDLELTPWLEAHRGIKFEGTAKASWSGATNICAVFFFTGDTSNVTIAGMSVSVPTSTGASGFVPVVFQFSPNVKSNQTFSPSTPYTSTYVAVPHNMTFENVTFDGTIMGYVGNLQSTTFTNITSHRYSDLQDANGNNVGGVGKWFAPPHLFYLGYLETEDQGLYNKNITIKSVVDDGPRLGKARDKGGSDTLSGNALSLKLGCYTCTVDTYTSMRPDGFMDVLPSNGLTISNANAVYDSSFTNNLYPGWRFPTLPYVNVTFENVTIKDDAESSIKAPIGNAYALNNENIVFKNVEATVNRWAGPAALPIPVIDGSGNSIQMEAIIESDSMVAMYNQSGTESVTVKGTQSALAVGSLTSVSWSSVGASSCAASGGLSGALSTSGTKSVKLASAGTTNFTVNCKNGSSTVTTTLPVAAL
jgi:hypothetical protein